MSIIYLSGNFSGQFSLYIFIKKAVWRIKIITKLYFDVLPISKQEVHGPILHTTLNQIHVSFLQQIKSTIYDHVYVITILICHGLISAIIFATGKCLCQS